MIDLISMLEAIRIYAKDCHYAFRGASDFIQNHKWVDDISEPMADYIDEIKESILAYHGTEIPRGVEINTRAQQYVPQDLPYDDNTRLLRNLRALIIMTIARIDELAKNASAGDSDILGRIGSFLQKQAGLLTLAVGE